MGNVGLGHASEGLWVTIGVSGSGVDHTICGAFR